MSTNPLRSSQLVPTPTTPTDEGESLPAPRNAVRSVDGARASVGVRNESSASPSSPQTEQVTGVFQATITPGSQPSAPQPTFAALQTRVQPGSRN